MGDNRKTIGVNQDFLATVKDLYETRQKAAILYEDNGVTRASGFISALFEKEGKPFLLLDGKLEIAVSSLYAVNGTFSTDYSEC